MGAMTTLAATPFLQRRKFAFYYRRAVPASLQASIGRKEIVVSLGTPDLKEAKRRYADHHAHVERMLSLAEGSSLRGSPERPTGARASPSRPLSLAFIQSAAAKHLERLEETDGAALLESSFDDIPAYLELVVKEASHYLNPDPDWAHIQPTADRILTEAGLSRSADDPLYWTLCARLNGAHLEHLKRHHYKVSGEPAPFIHRPTGLEIGTRPPKPPASSAVACTLSELLQRFHSDPARRNVRAKTKASAMATAQRVLLEVCGSDTPVVEIGRERLLHARQVLLDLPPRAQTRFPGMTLVEAASANRRDNGKKLSPKTVDNQLVWISALFAYAEREQLLQPSPAKHLGLGAAKATAHTRRPWSIDELNLLLSAPTFTSGIGDPALFWAPLLALYQGLRMNEACQLYSDDFQLLDGVYALRIASDPDRGQDTKKNDTRVVPVHPTLLELGLVKLFQRSEVGRVFPHLSLDRYGSTTNAFSKRFGRLSKAAGIKRAGVVFHSFRHNFADALRRARTPDEIADALGGWHSKGSARRGYGEGYQPADLLPALAQVEYVGLELSRLNPKF